METLSTRQKRTIPEQYTHITYEVKVNLFQKRIQLI